MGRPETHVLSDKDRIALLLTENKELHEQNFMLREQHRTVQKELARLVQKIDEHVFRVADEH